MCVLCCFVQFERREVRLMGGNKRQRLLFNNNSCICYVVVTRAIRENALTQSERT